MSKFNENHIWNILRSYAKDNNLVINQIESFNDFVNFGLQEIINQESTISIPNYKVKFGQISLAPPQVIEEDRNLVYSYPMDARRRDLNYDSAIQLDITETFFENDKKEVKHFPKVVIGRMPVMLKSEICNLSLLNENEMIQKGECIKDLGGYFIIKGNERVLVAQMRAIYNHIFVLKQKSNDKYKYIAESRSMSDETGHSILIQAMLSNDDRTIEFSLPYIKDPIPVGVVFKALGFNEDDIVNLIGFDNKSKYIKYILRDSFFCKNKEEALEFIGKSAMHIITEDKKIDYAKQVVENETLPHLGISGSILEQACFLGKMVKKLLMTNLQLRSEDDRDNYSNKRVESAGMLLYDIFRNLFKKFVQNIKAYIEKKKQRPDIISIISRIKSITKGIQTCMATGNWAVQRNASYMRTGVSQVLDRMTYNATLSHLRRVIIPMGKEGKNAAMRQIHGSSFGFICPAETPEGQKIGVVLNLAILAKITKRTSKVEVRNILDKIKNIIPVQDIDRKLISEYTSIILNGVIIGFCEDPHETIDIIKNKRAKGLINKEVSVSYDNIDNEIRIYSDEGRFIRPLLTLTDNRLNITLQDKYSWNNLIKKGYIQYVDASEIENSVIAMSPDDFKIQHNDFCEIHPSTMLGIMAGMIPFSDHSQSPRNCYQSSMGKQALGIPSYSYNLRTDTLLHVLHYPQKPIVHTKMAEIFGINEMPSGINAVVAIACYSGFNQEDSVMINQSSIERGLFNLTSYHSIDCIEKKRDTYSYEEICLPPQNSDPCIKEGDSKYFRRKTNVNYSLLDENGIIKPREKFVDGKWVGAATVVKKGDVIVGKIIVTGSKSSEENKIDASVVIQPGEEGTIDRVHVMTTPNGYKLVKIVIRVTRKPVLGDKLASRTGQKGTIGMVYRQEDMPFTSQGITPDIIINPLAIPSRMTINQLIECALGKECCISGNYGDATPFASTSINAADKLVEKMSEKIQDYGFQSQGWETMYNGMTGEMIESRIFIGPTYYQRLKHMVDDKMHARANGHVTMLTRQATEGRSRDGGLRFGKFCQSGA